MVEVLPHREKTGIWGIECRIERGVNFQLHSIIGPVVLKMHYRGGDVGVLLAKTYNLMQTVLSSSPSFPLVASHGGSTVVRPGMLFPKSRGQ